ncbi:hypothetical protein BDZ85DRAFT_171818, partial [Elsinoe ampelina]
VNRSSRVDAERHLYSDITCTWTRNRPCLVPSLVNTLLHRSDVANYVQRLALLGRNMFSDASAHIPSRMVDQQSACRLIDASGTSFSDDWEGQLLAGRVDAYVALILLRSERLTSLTMEWSFTRHTRLVGDLLRRNASKYMRLRSVQHHSFTRKPVGARTSDALSFFYLPVLEELTVHLDNPRTMVWPAADPPCPSMLTSLRLGGIREGQLAFVLSTTKNLKRLHWDWHYKSAFRHESNQPFLDVQAICDNLVPVRHSLKELVIQANCEIDDGMAHPWIMVRGSPTKMLDFRLDKLEIPLAFLVTFNPSNRIRLQDVVPRSIKTLVINLGLFPH